jgi:hypothetical protein
LLRLATREQEHFSFCSAAELEEQQAFCSFEVFFLLDA